MSVKQAKPSNPKPLNPLDYVSASDRFAAVVINQLAEEKTAGKVFATSIQHRPDGARIYSGILHLGDIVTKIGFVAEQGLLHGFIDEPGQAKLERESFEAALADAGLTLEQAEQARLTLRQMVNEAGAPRYLNVAAADLDATLKCLSSGRASEAAGIIKRLLS